jgi:hypothetical protein
MNCEAGTSIAVVPASTRSTKPAAMMITSTSCTWRRRSE